MVLPERLVVADVKLIAARLMLLEDDNALLEALALADVKLMVAMLALLADEDWSMLCESEVLDAKSKLDAELNALLLAAAGEDDAALRDEDTSEDNDTLEDNAGADNGIGVGVGLKTSLVVPDTNCVAVAVMRDVRVAVSKTVLVVGLMTMKFRASKKGKKVGFCRKSNV
jgi:hypothetical protein